MFLCYLLLSENDCGMREETRPYIDKDFYFLKNVTRANYSRDRLLFWLREDYESNFDLNSRFSAFKSVVIAVEWRNPKNKINR